MRWYSKAKHVAGSLSGAAPHTPPHRRRGLSGAISSPLMMRAQGGLKRKTLCCRTSRTPSSRPSCCAALQYSITTTALGQVHSQAKRAWLRALTVKVAACTAHEPSHLSLRSPAVPNRNMGVCFHCHRGTTASAHSSSGPAGARHQQDASWHVGLGQWAAESGRQSKF